MQNSRNALLPPTWVITCTGMCLLIWLLVSLKEIVVLLVVGYCIAYLMNPLLSKLERRGVNRPLGVVILVAGFTSILALLFFIAAPTVIREANSLADRFPEYLSTAQQKSKLLWSEYSHRLPVQLRKSVESRDYGLLLSKLELKNVADIGLAALSAILSGYSVILILTNLLLLPFIVYYLAVDFRWLHSGTLAIFPVPYRGKVRRLASQIDSSLSAFVGGQFIVGLVMFVLYAFGFGILGVELWFILALISGLGNCVPYLGTAAGVVLGSLMTLVTFGDLNHLFWLWGIFVAVQALEGSLITPYILGDRVGIPPLAVILAILVGGKLFGLLGIFLAIPGAAIVRVLASELQNWLKNRELQAE